MGFFDFLRSPNINQGLEEYDGIPDALLLDVRTEEEYREGHIPGSRNLPLHSIDQVKTMANHKGIPLFVYCHSGARSRQAAGLLEQMGYRKVRNLGGISSYLGKVERWA